MKFLFICDVILSVVLTIGVVMWLNPYVSSVWPAIGACLHLLVRGFFCHEALNVWTAGSADRWVATLSKKDYKTEIPVSVLLVLIHAFFGWGCWTGFYGGMTFFAMWGISQLLELTWLTITKLRTKEK